MFYILHLYRYLNYHIFSSCFPHIVNLACQAVLGMLTTVEFIDESAEDYEEYNVEGNMYNKDLIASIRSLINTVCSQVFASANILLIVIAQDSKQQFEKGSVCGTCKTV